MNVAARLLADENVPGAVVAALRQQGHDVAWIHEDAPGSPDADVLEGAQREGRVVTLTSPDHAVRSAVAAFASRADWTGQFAVVEDDRIRLRALPN